MLKESNYNMYIEIDGKRYIYNSISKAYLRMKDKKDFDIGLLSDEQINSLKENGFIIDENFSELDMLEYLYNKYYFSSTSLNIILTPTLACNFRCPYCFEKVDISYRQKKDFYTILKKYAERNFKYYNSIEISLFGGEPLLQRKELFDFLKYVKEEQKKYNFSFTTSITTNGSLIDEEVMKALLECNCRAIQVTIDGCRRVHDSQRVFLNGRPSYDLLVSKIRFAVNYIKMSKKNLKFILRINLKDVLLEEVEQTLREFPEEDRKGIQLLFRPIYETACFQEENFNDIRNLKQFYDMGAKYGYSIVKNNYFYKTCEACGDDNFFYLMPDMTMWKCINNLNYSGARFGYIDSAGVVNIDAEKVLNWRQAANCFKNEKCRECKMLPDCFGGCILYNAMNGMHLCKEFEMASLPFLYEKRNDY